MSTQTQPFAPVPEHDHSGPTDGSQCELCKLYQRGYWTGTDAILDYSRQTYSDGMRIGRTTALREQRELFVVILRGCIYGALIGLLLRAIIDSNKLPVPVAGA